MTAVKVTVAVLVLLAVFVWLGVQTSASIHTRQCIQNTERCR